MPVNLARPLRPREVWRRAVQFFDWWRGQLVAAWEDLSAHLAQRDGACACIHFEAAEVILCRVMPQRTELLHRIPRTGAPNELPKLIDQLLQDHAASIRQLEVQLPAEAMLRRRVHLPAAVGRRLQQAVGFQLERWLPLKADLVYYDCAVIATDEPRRRLLVEVAEARRELAGDLANRALKMGLRRVSISAGVLPDSMKAMRFLDKAATRGSGESQRARIWLAATAAVLVATLIAVAFVQYHVENKRLEAQAQSLKASSAAAARLRDSLQERVGRVEFLAGRLGAPDASAVLAELTRLLPNDAWVFQFQADGEQLQIAGFAKDASALSAVLSRSALFKQVSLRSAVKALGSGGERFDISIRLNAPNS